MLELRYIRKNKQKIATLKHSMPQSSANTRKFICYSVFPFKDTVCNSNKPVYTVTNTFYEVSLIINRIFPGHYFIYTEGPALH